MALDVHHDNCGKEKMNFPSLYTSRNQSSIILRTEDRKKETDEVRSRKDEWRFTQESIQLAGTYPDYPTGWIRLHVQTQSPRQLSVVNDVEKLSGSFLPRGIISLEGNTQH